MDGLFWSPLQRLYVLLQEHVRQNNAEAAIKDAQAHFDWLLHGVTSFKPPSSASKQAVNTSKTVTIQGKKLAINQRLLRATELLSVCLVRGRSRLLHAGDARGDLSALRTDGASSDHPALLPCAGLGRVPGAPGFEAMGQGLWAGRLVGRTAS